MRVGRERAHPQQDGGHAAEGHDQSSHAAADAREKKKASRAPQKKVERLSMYGLFLSIASDLVSPIGVAMQKTAHARRDKQVWRSPLWWFGIAVLVVAEVGNGIALGDTQVTTSAIAAVGCVGVVANGAISHYLLKEPVSRNHCIGAGLITLGVVQLVVFAPQRPHRLTVQEVRSCIVSTAAVVAYATTAACLLLSACVLGVVNHRGVGWLLPSAASGAGTVLAARYAFTLVSEAIVESVTLATDVWLYASIAVILVCGALQLYFFNRALAVVEARIVVPFFYTLFTIATSISGGVVYREFHEATLLQWMLFIDNCIIAIIGMILVMRPSSKPPPTSSTVESEAGTVGP